MIKKLFQKTEKKKDTPVQPQDNNKKKRKKKHRFLKFILFVALITLSYKGVKKICDGIALNKLYQFADRYPFEFMTDDESVEYIKNDFDVPVSYEYNGKQYPVTWSSDTPNIKIDGSGRAKVKCESKRTVNSTLKQEYSFLLGKAALTYEVRVIADDTLDESEIPIVNIDDVIDQSYPESMEIEINYYNQVVRSMYGEFSGLKINNIEDAVSVANAYKDNLRISENIYFQDAETATTNSYVLYTLQAYYDDVKISDSFLKLTVSKDDNELIKITNNVYDDPFCFSNKTESKDIQVKRLREYIDSSKCIQKEFQIFDNGTEYIDNVLSGKYLIYSRDGGFYEAIINEDEIRVNPLWGDFITRETTCKGKLETDEEVEFTASLEEVLGEKNYVLRDLKRKIAVKDNFGCWDNIGKENRNELETIGALIELLVSPNMNNQIHSDTNTFDNPFAVAGYINVQNAYDYYVKHFNRYSYNGKSKEINILNDCDFTTDNAAWFSNNAMVLCSPSIYKYSMGLFPEVIGHEYTHAVFQSINKKASNVEFRGINEGYADVFGILIGNIDDWIIAKNIKSADGSKVCIRDIWNMDHTVDGYKLNHDEVSLKYKDEIWQKTGGEEHAISVLISHVAATMDKSRYFDRDGIAKIWYDSMAFGYNNDSTFVDARKNIIRSAENLGYSKEAVDFIAHQFDLEEIFDSSYEITTEAFMDDSSSEGIISDYVVFTTYGDQIDGDLIYDDTTDRNFIFVFSPIGTEFAGTPILILEDDTGASAEEIEAAEIKLSKMISDMMNEGSDDPLEVTVSIRPKPKHVMKFLVKMVDKVETKINEQGNTEFRDMSKYFYVINSEKMTPYDYYKLIGAI